MTIKAIETQYKGFRFRSRLEARWAVFFDSLGVPYEYEAQGYDLDGLWYLPDFFLPELNCHIEIKPTFLVDKDWEKVRRLGESMAPAIALCGNPWPWEYFSYFAAAGVIVPVPSAQWALCDECRHVSLIVSSLDARNRLARLACSRDCLDCHVSRWPMPSQSPRVFSASDRMDCAYVAARSARFEHGESPR